MAKSIQGIRGMNDYLPKGIVCFQHLEMILKDVLNRYCYSEIRLPIVERTELFQRAMGQATDIIEKEMYTFTDRNGDSLTLRPEGTAGCVRAGIEHGLLYNQEQRLWYAGPMFRYERPQKGRYRQFYQIGAEIFGHYGPDVDVELILLTARWWKVLGINNYLSLEINTIGSMDARTRYTKAIVKFLSQHENKLDNDSRRRMYKNPMRIYDTKNPDIQKLLNDAPVLTNYIDEDSQIHFSRLCELLSLADIPYTINPRLVRGLDYYNRTVFEWVTTYLGSQGTICGGGRYDSLVQNLGGHATPAIGCAMGLDRLVLLMQTVKQNLSDTNHVDVYLIIASNTAQYTALQLADKLRDSLPSLRLMTNYGNGSFKKQFTRAHKYNARIALIVGEREVAVKQIVLKNLITGYQETVEERNIVTRLTSILYQGREYLGCP